MKHRFYRFCAKLLGRSPWWRFSALIGPGVPVCGLSRYRRGIGGRLYVETRWQPAMGIRAR